MRAALLLQSTSSDLSVPLLEGASEDVTRKSRMEWSKCSRRLTSNEFTSNIFRVFLIVSFFLSFYSGN